MKSKILVVTLTVLVTAFAMFLVSSRSASADQEPKWKKYSIEKNLNVLEGWAKKWPHIDSKDAGWNLTLNERLRAAQLWVDIQILKEMQKSEKIKPISPCTTPPNKIRHDWTELGNK
jgi:hypothetical protein